ncbi:cysteine synthase B, partial [mine drainage metagenome]
NNPANPRAHYETTGPEIWRDTCGIITHFVAGIGTGGTISGAGRYLKERSPSLQVLGVVPDAPLHGIEGLKHLPTSQLPGTLDLTVIDEQVPVSTEDAIAVARRLAREEGLYAGTSSGAAVHAALELARRLDRGVVVTILPDGGDRYRIPQGDGRGRA